MNDGAFGSTSKYHLPKKITRTLSCRTRLLPLLEVSRPPLLPETTLDTLIQLWCSQLLCEQERGDLFTKQSPQSSSFSQVPELCEDRLSSLVPPQPLSHSPPPLWDQSSPAPRGQLCLPLQAQSPFLYLSHLPTGSFWPVVGFLTQQTVCLHELLRRQRA